MNLRIRRANENDLPLLAEMESRLFRDGPWGESALAGQIAAPHTLSLLLLADEIPVGYLLAGFSPPEGELYRVAVLPDMRRTGCGRRLLSELFRIAKERGADALWLEVRESNQAAIALYRAVGFRVVARRENYYRNPCEAALLMTAECPKES